MDRPIPWLRGSVPRLGDRVSIDSLTVRVYNLHGITLRYAQSRRAGRYATLPASHQSIGTVSIAYTLLGQTHFGAVDWRPTAGRGP